MPYFPPLRPASPPLAEWGAGHSEHVVFGGRAKPQHVVFGGVAKPQRVVFGGRGLASTRGILWGCSRLADTSPKGRDKKKAPLTTLQTRSTDHTHRSCAVVNRHDVVVVRWPSSRRVGLRSLVKDRKGSERESRRRTSRGRCHRVM